MEKSFYKREITPIVRDCVVDTIDLYGKDHRTLVAQLSDAKLHRLALAFWTESECDREFLNESSLGNENFSTACRIALREPYPENFCDIGRITLELLVNFYRPRMQQCLDLMHEELREQIEADDHIAAGYRQAVDEQTGERRWVK